MDFIQICIKNLKFWTIFLKACYSTVVEFLKESEGFYLAKESFESLQEPI